MSPQQAEQLRNCGWTHPPGRTRPFDTYEARLVLRILRPLGVTVEAIRATRAINDVEKRRSELLGLSKQLKEREKLSWNVVYRADVGSRQYPSVVLRQAVGNRNRLITAELRKIH